MYDSDKLLKIDLLKGAVKCHFDAIWNSVCKLSLGAHVITETQYEYSNALNISFIY